MNHFTITKVLWSQDAAQREVQRLNSLNAEKGCRYFMQLTRVERRSGNIDQEAEQ